MNWLRLFDKNFYLWNFLGLLIAGTLLRLYRPEATLIEWPVSSLISIYLLSSSLYTLQTGNHKRLVFLLLFILFITLHAMLTGLFEIVLTRFLRYPEVYDFEHFLTYLIAHYTLLIDGGIWFFSYQCLFWGMNTTRQMESLNHTLSDLEGKLSASDLNLLASEINPHFLFNAMNGIAMKVRLNENKTAVSMITALNDLLRMSLRGQNDQLITLSEELELLEKYLMIEKTRFGNHISWSVHIPDDLKTCKLPRLILQPLVENAFKHGMNNDVDNMIIHMECEKHDRSMNIRIYNSQKDPSKINYATGNIGLPNVVHRLRQFYRSDFQFKSFIEPDGVAFQITIPIQS